MNKIEYLLSFFIIFFNIISCSEENSNKNNEYIKNVQNDNNDTVVGLKILNIEEKTMSDFNAESYNYFTELVNAITSKVKNKNNYNRNEAEQIMESIGNIIADIGIEPTNTSLSFNKALISKKFCCYTFSFIYLSVAKKLNLPLYPAIVPGHIFIIWDDGQEILWWETTGNFLSSQQYYIDYFHLSKREIDNYLYFRKLTNRELDGLIYSEIGAKAELHINIEYLTYCINILPTYEFAYKNRGNAKYKLNDFFGADEDWQKVLEINPEYYDYKFYSDFGSVKYEMSNFKDAIELFNKSISINPKIAQTYLGRGNAKSLKNDMVGAIQDFTKAIEIDSSFCKPYYNRGILFHSLKQYKKAIEDFNNATKYGCANPLVYFKRGDSYNNIHDFRKAIKDFDIAISLDNNYAQAYYCRGLAKLLLNNKDGCNDLTIAEKLGYTEASEIILHSCK